MIQRIEAFFNREKRGTDKGQTIDPRICAFSKKENGADRYGHDKSMRFSFFDFIKETMKMGISCFSIWESAKTGGADLG